MSCECGFGQEICEWVDLGDNFDRMGEHIVWSFCEANNTARHAFSIDV